MGRPKKKNNRTYNHYYLVVSGHRDNKQESSSRPGETLSKAVESFLQDVLKNKNVRVQIEEHFTTVKEI